jgi:uncharacterized membrane protein HdeD (DUF308 family)
MRWVGLYLLIAGVFLIAMSANAPTANWAEFYFGVALAIVGAVALVAGVLHQRGSLRAARSGRPSRGHGHAGPQQAG